MFNRDFKPWLVTVCWGIGTSAVVLSVFLLRQNLDLRSALASELEPDALTAGVAVPPLVGSSPLGAFTLDTLKAKRGAILLVFSPFCPACDRNLPFWEKLVQSPLRDHYEVIGVDMSGGQRPQYLKDHGVETSVIVTCLSPVVIGAYRFRLTPQTLVLRHGKAAGVWTGVLNDADLAEIRKVAATMRAADNTSAIRHAARTEASSR